ncbi:MAG: 30S ribosome-binding factor RbfA [Alphaproteobacteria bacterium]|nr:30S ribosome-binding factor RbfA [Alphaproteobacteria bacterium]
MRTQRQLRVGEAIRHALADVLQRGDVPWHKGFMAGGDIPFITITEVQVSPDLKNASAFVMPLGGVRLQDSVKAMNDIVKFFRHEVAKAVDLRYAPMLHFVPDNSFDYATKIERILHDPAVAKDLKAPEEE